MPRAPVSASLAAHANIIIRMKSAAKDKYVLSFGSWANDELARNACQFELQ
jgi:hypothetical protein